MNFMSEGKKCNCGHQEQCACKKRHMVHSGECELKHHHYAMGEKRNHCCEHQHEACPEKVKGFNLCRRRNELRCFKQCEPISQPCNDVYFPYFQSRTNADFSGLVVVSNTGNLTNGCAIDVEVTDRAGVVEPITVNPGASIPIFVEGLTLLRIKCREIAFPGQPICEGEIRFDLEYCASRECF